MSARLDEIGNTVLKRGRFRGRRVCDLSWEEIHRLWAGVNGSPKQQELARAVRFYIDAGRVNPYTPAKSSEPTLF